MYSNPKFRHTLLSVFVMLLSLLLGVGTAYASASGLVSIKDDAKILNAAQVYAQSALLRSLNVSIVVYTFNRNFSGNKDQDSYGFDQQCKTQVSATVSTVILCETPGDTTHYSYYVGGGQTFAVGGGQSPLTSGQVEAAKAAFIKGLGKNKNFTAGTIAWLKVVADALKANPHPTTYDSAENMTEQNLPEILAVIIVLFCLAVVVMFVKRQRRGGRVVVPEEAQRRVVVLEVPQRLPERLPAPRPARLDKQRELRQPRQRYLSPPLARNSAGPSQQGPSSSILWDAKVGDVVRVMRDGIKGTGIVVQKDVKASRLDVEMIITHNSHGRRIIPLRKAFSGSSYNFQSTPDEIYRSVKRYVREDEEGWDVRHDLRQMGLLYVLDD